MANNVKPIDLYNDFNTLTAQETGGGLSNMTGLVNAITVGQAAQLWGYETTLNKLSLAMGNTLIAVRPYSGNFSIMEERYDEYGQFLRKISYFTDTFEASQDWNTVSNLNQLDDGNSIDHYKIRKRYPLEVWFNGQKVLQKHFTRFRKQLKVAFSSAEEFARFYEGELVQINNEIQMKKETGNRMITLNFILGCLFGTGYPDGMKRNLTAEFNNKFGTTYKTKDLLSTHLPEFTKFFASILKYQSDMMARPTTMFHATPTNQKNDAQEALTLWRHTPKSEQRLLLASNVLYDMESLVYPEIFHDGYLRLSQYESIPFWQSPNDPLHIAADKANVLNVATGLSTDVTCTGIENKVILGIMYDRMALQTAYHQEDVVTTPVNAAGDYYNTYYHWAMDFRNDFTENAVVFYMEDTD